MHKQIRFQTSFRVAIITAIVVTIFGLFAFMPTMAENSNIKLSDIQVTGGVIRGFEISADNNWVVYHADHTLEDVIERFGTTTPQRSRSSWSLLAGHCCSQHGDAVATARPELRPGRQAGARWRTTWRVACDSQRIRSRQLRPDPDRSARCLTPNVTGGRSRRIPCRRPTPSPGRSPEWSVRE